MDSPAANLPAATCRKGNTWAPKSHFAQALLLLTVGACSSDALNDPAETVQIRDSARIRISETLTPIGENRDGWGVSHSPTLTISTPTIDGGYVLHWMRGAVRLSDGRIAALSEGSKELFFFDKGGTFQGAVGREGDGPGEFRRPIRLNRLPGDTLMVTERGAGRISWFSPDGDFLRGLAPDQNRLLAEIPEGYRRGGSSFFIPGGFFLLGVVDSPRSPQEIPLRVRWRDTVGYLVVSADGTGSAFLGPFAGHERFYLEPTLGRTAFFGAAPFVTYRANPVGIYIGDSKTVDLRVYSGSGNLMQIIRDGIPPDPIESTDIQWERHELLAWGEGFGGLERWTRLADAIPIPAEKPAFEDLVVDSEGFLWIKEYSSHRPDPIRYRIYSPEGIRVGTVRLPGFFRVFDIGIDYVLGLRHDEDYVERIELFALSRPTTH